MVKWIKQIQGNLQVQFGKNVSKSEILKVILKQPCFLSRSHINLIYVGGSAAALRNFSGIRANVAYDIDIHANAKGYEFLALQKLKKRGAA